MGRMKDGAMRLCRAQWFNGIYRRIYAVLNVEGMLPGPCRISVLPVDALETVGGIIEAAAIKEGNMLWFKVQPPSPITFAHELIHLIRWKDEELEEAYAYNLSPLAVLLAERGVEPPANIVKLFNATLDMVLEAVNNAYGYNFNNITEYLELKGDIPHFFTLKVKKDGSIEYKIKKGYTEKDIAVDIVSELAITAERDERALKALLLLLEWLRGSR